MDEMNLYQIATGRTDNYHTKIAALTNFGLGIGGESGEVQDLIKKVVFHGHEMDKEKFKSELGDVLWYVARIAHWAGLTLEEVAQGNIDKLKRRYPDGFSKEKSINRVENKQTPNTDCTKENCNKKCPGWNACERTWNDLQREDI